MTEQEKEEEGYYHPWKDLLRALDMDKLSQPLDVTELLRHKAKPTIQMVQEVLHWSLSEEITQNLRNGAFQETAMLLALRELFVAWQRSIGVRSY